MSGKIVTRAGPWRPGKGLLLPSNLLSIHSSKTDLRKVVLIVRQDMCSQFPVVQNTTNEIRFSKRIIVTVVTMERFLVNATYGMYLRHKYPDHITHPTMSCHKGRIPNPNCWRPWGTSRSPGQTSNAVQLSSWCREM
jgi:hypothetical protein